MVAVLVMLGRISATILMLLMMLMIPPTATAVRVPRDVLAGFGRVADLQAALGPRAHLDPIVHLPEGDGGILRILVGDEGTAAVGAVVLVPDDGHVGEGSVAGEDGDEVGLVAGAGDLADEELDVGTARFGMLLLVLLIVGTWRLVFGVIAGTLRTVEGGTNIGSRHDGDRGGGVSLLLGVHCGRLHLGLYLGRIDRLVRRGADNDGRTTHRYDVAEGDSAPLGLHAVNRSAVEDGTVEHGPDGHVLGQDNGSGSLEMRLGGHVIVRSSADHRRSRGRSSVRQDGSRSCRLGCFRRRRRRSSSGAGLIGGCLGGWTAATGRGSIGIGSTFAAPSGRILLRRRCRCCGSIGGRLGRHGRERQRHGSRGGRWSNPRHGKMRGYCIWGKVRGVYPQEFN